MKKLLMPLLVLFFCGVTMTACDDGDKDKEEEAPAAMPTPSDFGGGGT